MAINNIREKKPHIDTYALFVTAEYRRDISKYRLFRWNNEWNSAADRLNTNIHSKKEGQKCVGCDRCWCCCRRRRRISSTMRQRDHDPYSAPFAHEYAGANKLCATKRCFVILLAYHERKWIAWKLWLENVNGTRTNTLTHHTQIFICRRCGESTYAPSYAHTTFLLAQAKYLGSLVGCSRIHNTAVIHGSYHIVNGSRCVILFLGSWLWRRVLFNRFVFGFRLFCVTHSHIAQIHTLRTYV